MCRSEGVAPREQGRQGEGSTDTESQVKANPYPRQESSAPNCRQSLQRPTRARWWRHGEGWWRHFGAEALGGGRCPCLFHATAQRHAWFGRVGASFCAIVLSLSPDTFILKLPRTPFLWHQHETLACVENIAAVCFPAGG